MDPVLLPLLSALVGALIGSGTSVLVIYLQGRQEERKHVRQLAAQLAIEDFQRGFDLVKLQGGNLAPLSAFVAYYLRLSDKMRTGTLSEDDFAAADDYLQSLLKDRNGKVSPDKE